MCLGVDRVIVCSCLDALLSYPFPSPTHPSFPPSLPALRSSSCPLALTACVGGHVARACMVDWEEVPFVHFIHQATTHFPSSFPPFPSPSLSLPSPFPVVSLTFPSSSPSLSLPIPSSFPPLSLTFLFPSPSPPLSSLSLTFPSPSKPFPLTFPSPFPPITFT
ncbi:unnamed protein product [Closterium sp. Naga37s-1]|nr:unnamed protein product [Closterium sp. Naga37s-1]